MEDVLINQKVLSIEEINLEIRKYHLSKDVKDFISDLDNIITENGLNGCTLTFRDSKVSIIIQDYLDSIQDRNVECFSLYFDKIRMGYIYFELTCINKFVDYISDICYKLEKPFDEITIDYIKKFSNPFVQDSELLKKYNLKSTQLMYYIKTNENTLTDLLDEVKSSLSKKL